MGIYGKKTESVWFRRRGTNVSLTTAPFHRCSRKTDLDNMETNGQSCVPIKLYLQNWAGGQTWGAGHSLLIPRLEQFLQDAHLMRINGGTGTPHIFPPSNSMMLCV